MARQVLIVQSDSRGANALAELFTRRGDTAWQTTDAREAFGLLERHAPTLLVLDLHLPGDGDAWLELLRQSRARPAPPDVILTNRRPDLLRELLAKGQGARVFLREPFTADWLERALQRLTESAQPPAARRPERLPRVRMPVRFKITLPYALLALIFAVAAAYLVSRYVLESISDRFMGQLIDAGKLSADWMVREENRLLTSLRLLSNLEGMPEALVDGQAERLRALAYPVAVNYHEEAIEILDPQGESLLSLRHVTGGLVDEYEIVQGDQDFQAWAFVQQVLANRLDSQGDKFAGVARAAWGDYFYVAGPVYDQDGRFAGAILVGKSLASLAREMRQDTLGHITFYSPSGDRLASTLPASEEVEPLPAGQAAAILSDQDRESWLRDLQLASVRYSEVVGPWEARNGEDLGLAGAALAQNFLARPTLVTNVQAFSIVMAAFLAIIAVGLSVAHRITRPLMQMVRATSEVAAGNFDVKVDASGDDEVAFLGHAFNYMITGLQEGSIYRDLLGRTVSPQVRDQLRESFASGGLKLEGQAAVATVLMSDIRGFTSMAEQVEPPTILAWLNEYFGELVPIITARGGVVDKFEGDAILAFFGILPRPLPPDESAYQACQAAVELLQAVRRLNQRRQARGDPLFITGLGLNTGPVTAGGLGTSDRLNYTIIGDTVNTTQRLENFTRKFGESGAILSEHTLRALQSRHEDFNISPLGAHTFKGKAEPLAVYRLWPSAVGFEMAENG